MIVAGDKLKAVRTDIVVPIRNARKQVRQLLQSIENSRRNSDFMLTLVDDDSEIALATELKEFEHSNNGWVTLLRNKTNLGFSGSANAGIRAVANDADRVLILNSDTVLPTNWHNQAEWAMTQNRWIGAVGAVSNNAGNQSLMEYQGATESSKNRNQLQNHVDIVNRQLEKKLGRRFRYATSINGFFMYVRTESLSEVGVFDSQNFPMGYGEETDLCIRLQEAGYLLGVIENLFVFHHKSASFGSRRHALTEQGMRKLGDKWGPRIISATVEEANLLSRELNSA